MHTNSSVLSAVTEIRSLYTTEYTQKHHSVPGHVHKAKPAHDSTQCLYEVSVSFSGFRETPRVCVCVPAQCLAPLSSWSHRAASPCIVRVLRKFLVGTVFPRAAACTRNSTTVVETLQRRNEAVGTWLVGNGAGARRASLLYNDGARGTLAARPRRASPLHEGVDDALVLVQRRHAQPLGRHERVHLCCLIFR